MAGRTTACANRDWVKVVEQQSPARHEIHSGDVYIGVTAQAIDICVMPPQHESESVGRIATKLVGLRAWQPPTRRSCLRKQKAKYRLGIHLGRRGHAFVSLAGQFLDAGVRENRGQSVGDIEVARTFAADLEQHRHAKLTEALGLEVVPAQRTQIT
jgi:hypothetical protein